MLFRSTIAILVKLDRPFALTDRLAMIPRCLENKKFTEAYYLARVLPSNAEKKSLLDCIAKQAAFGDDYSTARSAALLSEQIHLNQTS